MKNIRSLYVVQIDLLKSIYFTLIPFSILDIFSYYAYCDNLNWKSDYV